MTVFLVDVSPTNPAIIAGRRKSYIRNRLFSWGAPLIVVGICVALQLTSTGNVAYGEFYTLLSRAQHYSRVQRPRPFRSTPIKSQPLVGVLNKTETIALLHNSVHFFFVFHLYFSLFYMHRCYATRHYITLHYSMLTIKD